MKGVEGVIWSIQKWKSLNRNIWKIRTTNSKAREKGVRPVYQITHRVFSTWLLPSH